MNNYYNSPFYNMDLTQRPIQPQQMVNNQQQDFSQMQPIAQRPVQPMPMAPEANIVSGGFKFSVYKDDDRPRRPTDLIVDEDGSTLEQKKRRGRPRKSEQQSDIVSSTGIVKVNGNTDPASMPTMYTYQETTDMLRGTMMQIDQLAGQVKTELDNVISSRTLKGKHNIMVGLSGNLSELISTKITAIKEINNAISKSNDMDYKKAKDAKAEAAGVNDDKYLMDLYNALIQNPGGQSAPLGPTGMDATLGSTNIVRASTAPQQQGFAPETGYLSYVTNMTPEQRLMMMEDNPNIKLCLVYDAATNNKAFQYMDMSTGQAVPGLPARDPMFLEDTTIDLRNKIAKNINLNETYPVVVINDSGVLKEY